MTSLRVVLSFSIAVFSFSFATAKQGNSNHLSAYVSHEYLNNGLTYCVAQTSVPNSVVTIKLAVQFEDKWATKREQALSHLMEKLVLETLDKAQRFEQSKGSIAKNQIHTHQPELFAVPNMTLYKWEIGHPTQTQIDSIFSFLSNALEDLAKEDSSKIESRLESILGCSSEGACTMRKKQPFFENDPNFYEHSVQALSDLNPKITGTEIKSFYHEHYKPKNMILFVQGNISKLAISNSIKSHFSSLIATEDNSSKVFANEEKPSPLSEDFIFDTDDSYDISRLNIQKDNSELKWQFCSDKIIEEEEKEPKAFEDLLLTDREKKIIHKMIHNLSRSNIALLLWKKKDLEKWGRSVNHVHPLKFLETIIVSPTLRSDLQEIRRNFFKWSLFMDNFRRRMTEEFYKESLQPFVEGFCKEIFISEEVVQHFVDRRDWEGLVKAVLY